MEYLILSNLNPKLFAELPSEGQDLLANAIARRVDGQELMANAIARRAEGQALLQKAIARRDQDQGLIP